MLRIGEVSKRSGVSPELLRAWERRYGLLRPTRSPGGLRLYSLDDLERVRAMRRHLDEGVAAAEAAALAVGATSATESPLPYAEARRELADALDAFDEPHAQAVLDRVLGMATVDAFLQEVVLPYLHELGERWGRGEASVAQEHFASAVLRGRLLGLARGWGRGLGPLALLACLPGEQHEFGLIALGLALRARGWRIAYLGSDTPLDTIERTADALAPAVVVVGALDESRVLGVRKPLQALAQRHRVVLGGVEADAGIDVLGGDPVEAAERLAA